MAPVPGPGGRVGLPGLLALAWLAGSVVLLASLPRAVPVPEDVASAAARAGYHTGVAYLAAAAWTLLGLAACALLARRGALRLPPPEGTPAAGEARPPAWLELGVLFAVFALAYCPLFLARHGPYSEDHIYLSLLQRMAAGQRPYVDFEFLYGPLLIAPAHAWTSLFGASMRSYYALTALLEAGQAVLLMAVLRRFLPGPRERWLVFLLLLPLLLNTLLGVNWNGLRRLVPAFVLLLLAHGPLRPGPALGAAALLGFQLAYSHDYGLAALAAAGAVYGLVLVRGQARAVPFGLAFLVVSLGVGAGLAGLALGSDVGAWLALSRELVARYDAGEAGFAFAWTANALAVFALLALAVVAVGRGLALREPRPLTAGDALLLGGLAYAGVALKSGLNRSDFWHLDAILLPLLFAFLLPLPRAVFALEPRLRRLARGAVAVLSVTALVGLLPLGSALARGWLRGAADVLAGRPAGVDPAPVLRGPSVELERTQPDPAVLELGAWLAAPERAARPVVYYGLAWALGPRVGAPKADFLNDDFVYSEERAAQLARQLAELPDPLVVMHRAQYERLFGLAPADAFPELAWLVQPSLLKRVARWTTSNHYDAVPLEVRAREARLARHAGARLVQRYEETARFGDWVVLERIDGARP